MSDHSIGGGKCGIDKWRLDFHVARMKFFIIHKCYQIINRKSNLFYPHGYENCCQLHINVDP